MLFRFLSPLVCGCGSCGLSLDFETSVLKSARGGSLHFPFLFCSELFSSIATSLGTTYLGGGRDAACACRVLEDELEQLRHQLRETVDENGRLYKLLKERDFEIKHLKKKLEDDRFAFTGSSTTVAMGKQRVPGGRCPGRVLRVRCGQACPDESPK